MSGYTDALRWLYSFTDAEIVPLAAVDPARLQLAPVRALLARLDDPQVGRGTVHITGSKGKGSTAAMIEAMLRAAGERTGLYTSPHLHHETERTRIDGVPISTDTFVRLIDVLAPQVAPVLASVGRLTTFDLRTALAFLAFREAGVTWQVIEVGIGGRLDSTNVLDEKAVCVFTPVSLEHTQALGNTVAEIAGDKAGILRAGCRAVMSPQRESAAEVFRTRCAALGVPLAEVATSCQLSVDATTADGQRFRIKTPRATYRIELPLLGRHQVENAATAILAVENLADADLSVDAATVRQGLGEVRWPGRMELLKRSPLLLVDGAHTPDSAKRLGQALRETFSPRRIIIVAGLSSDKDITGFADALLAQLGEASVIATHAAGGRAAASARVADAFAAAGATVRIAPSVAVAVDDALAEASGADLICITGSLFVVAEARAWLLGILPDGALDAVPPTAVAREEA